jgi:hypothetical protein
MWDVVLDNVQRRLEYSTHEFSDADFDS